MVFLSSCILPTFLPFPKSLIEEITCIMHEYVWKGKSIKVKKNVVIQDYSDGGYRMPDMYTIVKSQKLKWVKQVLVIMKLYGKTQ